MQKKNHLLILFRNTFFVPRQSFQYCLWINCWKAHVGSVSRRNLGLISGMQTNVSYQHCYTGIRWWSWASWRSVILSKHCSGPLGSIRHHRAHEISVPDKSRAAIREEKKQVLLVHACVPRVMGFPGGCLNKAEPWMEFSLTWKSWKLLHPQSNHKKWHTSGCIMTPHS